MNLDYKPYDFVEVLEMIHNGETVKSCTNNVIDIETCLEKRKDVTTTYLCEMLNGVGNEKDICKKLSNAMESWVADAVEDFVNEHNQTVGAA